jgi:predicted dehydrogenase
MRHDDSVPSTGNWSRRDFLKATAVAAIATQQVAQNAHAAPAPDKKIRMGIVGGSFGCSFFWHMHPNSTVTAVCDIDPEALDRLSRTYECQTQYDDFDKLIADKNVDAVGVYTPAPLHAYMACKAMEAGKHVISAVPMGYTVDECQQIIDTCKKTGRTYMMCETSAYHPETIDARQAYRNGEFGEIFFAEAEYHHPGLERIMFNHKTKLPTWRHGLPPMLYPTHCTSMLLSVTRERFTDVVAHGWGDHSEIIQTNLYENPFWNTVGLFKTNRGNSAKVAIFWNVASTPFERGALYGIKKSIVWPSPFQDKTLIGYNVPNPGYVQVDRSNHYDLLPEPLRVPSGHEGSHTHLTNEFISALVEGRRPLVDEYEAAAYTVPGIMAHQSALKNGEAMKIPNLDASAGRTDPK